MVTTYIIQRILTLQAHETSLKGLLAELQLLYKFVTSFGLKTTGPLEPITIFETIQQSLVKKDSKIRNQASKILFEIHSKTGYVDTELLKDIPKNIRDNLLK